MRLGLSLGGTVLLMGAGGGCVPSSVERRPTAWREDSFPVEKRPPRAPDCAFELYELHPPSRPYRSIGTVPVSVSVNDDAFFMKSVLRPTVCRTGADAVRLEPVRTRIVGKTFEREFRASLLVYTDMPEPVPQAR